MARSLLSPLAQENTSPAHRNLGAECCYSETRSLLHTAGVLLALSRTMFLLGTLSAGFVLCAVQVRPTASEMMVSDVDPLQGDPTANKDGIQCRDWTLLSPPQCRGSLCLFLFFFFLIQNLLYVYKFVQIQKSMQKRQSTLQFASHP